MKLNILLFSLILLGLLGCNKDERESCLISPAMKNSFGFKKGTYWIYRNDSTMIEDSIYTDTLEFNMIAPYQGPYQEMYCITKSSLDSTLKIQYIVRAQECFKYDYGASLGTGGFGSAFIVTKDEVNIFYRKKYGELIQSNAMLLNGNLFNSVYKFYSVPDTCSVFIVEGTGIIKWTIQHSNGLFESWSLIRMQRAI